MAKAKSDVPAYEQVKAWIRQHIGSGRWKPGDPVPSEAALMQQFGISRMTVNRALRELVEQGRIVRVAGVGSFVAEDKPQSTLLQIVRQGDAKKMLALVEKVAQGGATTRKDLRAETAKGKPGRPKAFVFAFKPETKQFNLRMSFRKGRVDKAEIISALEQIIRELRASR